MTNDTTIVRSKKKKNINILKKKKRGNQNLKNVIGMDMLGQLTEDAEEKDANLQPGGNSFNIPDIHRPSGYERAMEIKSNQGYTENNSGNHTPPAPDTEIPGAAPWETPKHYAAVATAQTMEPGAQISMRNNNNSNNKTNG